MQGVWLIWQAVQTQGWPFQAASTVLDQSWRSKVSVGSLLSGAVSEARELLLDFARNEAKYESWAVLRPLEMLPKPVLGFTLKKVRGRLIT